MTVTFRVQVLKLDLAGKVTWQYEGRVLRVDERAVTLEAFFDRADTPVADVVLKAGDRFVETFYADRWYNLFEIYDRDDGRLKGWYCNIGHPAVLADGSISYVDLALDLWVSGDGTQTVLDEEEFRALPLEARDRDRALAALSGLQKAFSAQRPPP
jgi:protein associated with RNAse G/E